MARDRDRDRRDDETTSSSSSKDPISACIGDCGRWQFGVGVLVGFLKFSLAWSQFGIVFMAPPTRFRCLDPSEEDSAAFGDGNETHRDAFGKCSLNGSDVECERFAYESVFRSSIITEWNLVCSRKFLVELTQISFMGGFLVGSVLFGILSDKFGRRRPLLVAIVAQIVSSFFIAFAPWFSAFLWARFVSSLASGGLSVISFVLCMESFGGKWRTIMPILYHAPIGVGNALMAALAYHLRDWRHLQLSLCLLSTLYLIYLWLVPESPRWLLATNRTKEAVELLERAAIVNGRNPNPVQAIIARYKPTVVSQMDRRKAVRTMFKSGDLKLKTAILCVEWFGAGVAVFAFIQNVGNVSANIFVASTVMGLNVIPGTPLCIYLANRFARKSVIGAAQLSAALIFALIVCVPRGEYAYDWPRIVLSALGIITIDVFVAMLYVYSGEMYPTVVRNAAIGGVTVASRVGSMLAPLVLSMEAVSPALPLGALSALMVALALCLLALPGTDAAAPLDNLQFDEEADEEPLRRDGNGNEK